MKVWMTARATGNPYMTLLTDHLGERGVELRATPRQHDMCLELARGGRPDVLHVHWLYDFFLRGKPSESAVSRGYAWVLARWFVGLLDVLKARGTRIVWTAHNAHNHEARKPDIDRYCYEAVVSRSDAILAHSATAKALLIEEFGIADADKVHVIPHGHYIGAYPDAVDAAQARDALGLDDRLVFTFFGRVRPYKNVPRLVDAFADLVDREGLGGQALLVIAGKPSPENHDAEIRQRIGGRDDVRFDAEFIDDADVQLYMRAADVVVLPYQEILTSGSAVLAMSFGRPVVAPRLGTLRDVLTQQDELLYPVEPDGVGPLVEAMARAARLGRARLGAIGQDNLERAREWDWPGVARQTQDVYAHVLGRRATDE